MFDWIMVKKKLSGLDFGAETLRIATDDFDGTVTLLGEVPSEVGLWFLVDFLEIVGHLELQVYANRAVVGTRVVFVDFGGLKIFLERFRDEEVVDAPADIVGAIRAPVAPPSIANCDRVESAERVDKTSLD